MLPEFSNDLDSPDLVSGQAELEFQQYLQARSPLHLENLPNDFQNTLECIRLNLNHFKPSMIS